MNLLNFDFIPETVSANSVSGNFIAGQYQIDMITKIYNLLLLFVWFEIMKYCVSMIRFAFRKLKGFDD